MLTTTLYYFLPISLVALLNILYLVRSESVAASMGDPLVTPVTTLGAAATSGTIENTSEIRRINDGVVEMNTNASGLQDGKSQSTNASDIKEGNANARDRGTSEVSFDNVPEVKTNQSNAANIERSTEQKSKTNRSDSEALTNSLNPTEINSTDSFEINVSNDTLSPNETNIANGTLTPTSITLTTTPQYVIDPKSIQTVDGIDYYNISSKAMARSNVTNHRPAIKHSEAGGVKKFTIQDTFDILKDFDDQEDKEISKLTKYIMKQYLSNCMIIFLYDEIFYASVTLRAVITDILEYSPLPIMHGMINTSGLAYHTSPDLLDPPVRKCRNFIILTKNLENSAEIMGRQRESRIVFIAYMSSYQIKTFLSESLSHNIVNLLIVADPNLQHDDFNKKSEFYSIDMYTHRLHTDSLGTSIPWVLTSWRNGNLTRSGVNLFPDKLDKGFHGHRFIVSVAQQPPFIFRRQKFEHDMSGNMIQTETDEWDGLELKILKHMAQYLNMTLEIRETSGSNPGDGGPGHVIYDIMQEKATIGISGMPMTNGRIENVSFSVSHTQDCAVFMSVTSLALSKYRAIFGPFKWEVWVCLVLVYLLAIIPLSFTDKLTLRHLWEKPSEIENMFWYMFGTFTNLFTFRNTNSWTSSKKGSTRAFVGTYWVFSIIITAAYTGSIIAFITLPVFPETIDTLQQLKAERYRIITLDNSGWQYFNDTEKKSLEHDVLEDWELVPRVEDGLRNVTKGHLLWSYAFLGSKAQLEHIVKNNFENAKKKKRSKKLFHMSRQCYLPMHLAFAYPKSSLLNTQLDLFILKAKQSGLLNKWMRDVQWDNWRNVKGGRLQAGAGSLKFTVPEDRMLTLDDTLGMFLLLAFGFSLAVLAFFNECLTRFNYQLLRCKGRSEEAPHPPPPTITLTSADQAHGPSEETMQEQASVYTAQSEEELSCDRNNRSQSYDSNNTEEVHSYDLSNADHREMIVMSISPHRRYSMNQIDDRTLVDWSKRRESY